jgi:iron complex outermembrane receptor protein
MGARNYLQRKKKGLDMKGMDRFVYWAIFTGVSSLDRLGKFPRTPHGRRFTPKIRVIVFWTGLLLLTPGYNPDQTSAEEKEEVPVLQEVVVTATRQEEEIRKIPANVTVITEDDIENSNAKTVLDLLRSEEGIVVRDLLGNGKTAQVDLRGFGETGPFNTLVIVDGRRVNEIDLSGADWMQIPLEQIERIEIVRGTGTVLYGDNAVGGVINIITKPPAEKLTATVGTIAGSYERIKGHASVGGGYENIAGSLYASYESTDGYRKNNEFRTRDVGGKIVLDATDYLSFTLSGSHHRDDFGLPGPLTEAQATIDRESTTRPFDDGETTDQYIALGGDWDLGEYGRVVCDFSFRDRDSDAEFVITPRYSWNGNILNHANTVIAGLDIYYSDLDADFSFGAPLVPSGLADIEKESYGLYFNNEFSILENLILSVGARHERVRYDLEQQDFLFGFAPLDAVVRDREAAYSVGLTFLYNERSSLFARVNRSFRFPLTDELVLFDFFTGRIRVNQDIEPQKGHHYEVGARHFFAPDIEALRFLAPQIEARATLFRAEIDDEIFFNPLTFTNENHPETLHQGAEIGIKGNFFKRLTVFGNYTFERAQFRREPFQYNEIPAVPRHKANLGFRIYDLIPGLIFSANYNFVGSSFLISDQANRFRKLEQYNTIDARVSYEWKWINAFVGVNNIANRKYSEYAVLGGFPTVRNFYPAPERNWIAGLEAVF